MNRTNKIENKSESKIPFPRGITNRKSRCQTFSKFTGSLQNNSNTFRRNCNKENENKKSFVKTIEIVNFENSMTSPLPPVPKTTRNKKFKTSFTKNVENFKQNSKSRKMKEIKSKQQRGKQTIKKSLTPITNAQRKSKSELKKSEALVPSENSTFKFTPTYYDPSKLKTYKFDSDLALALAKVRVSKTRMKTRERSMDLDGKRRQSNNTSLSSISSFRNKTSESRTSLNNTGGLLRPYHTSGGESVLNSWRGVSLGVNIDCKLNTEI